MVSDIPSGDGKTAILFLQCTGQVVVYTGWSPIHVQTMHRLAGWYLTHWFPGLQYCIGLAGTVANSLLYKIFPPAPTLKATGLTKFAVVLILLLVLFDGLNCRACIYDFQGNV